MEEYIKFLKSYLEKTGKDSGDDSVNEQVQIFNQNPGQYIFDAYKEMGRDLTIDEVRNVGDYMGLDGDSFSDVNGVSYDRPDVQGDIDSMMNLDKERLKLGASNKNDSVLDKAVGIEMTNRAISRSGNIMSGSNASLYGKLGEVENRKSEEEERADIRKRLIEDLDAFAAKEAEFKDSLKDKNYRYIPMSDFYNKHKSKDGQISKVANVYEKVEADSNAYMNLLTKSISSKKEKIEDEEEYEIAEEIIAGENIVLPDGVSKELLDVQKSVNVLKKQYADHLDLFSDGDGKTYTQKQMDATKKISADRDRNQNFFLSSRDDEGRERPSSIETSFIAALSGFSDFFKSAPGEDEDTVDRFKRAYSKGVYNDDVKDVLKEYGRRKTSNEITKHLETSKGQKSSFMYRNYVDVDGVKITVDSNGDPLDVLDVEGNLIYDVSGEEEKALNKYISNKEKYDRKSEYGGLRNVANLSADVLTYMVPMMAAGYATGGVATVAGLSSAAAGTASMAATAATVFVQSYAETRDQAIDEFNDVEDAKTYAMLVAGGESAMTFIFPKLEQSIGKKAARNLAGLHKESAKEIFKVYNAAAKATGKKSLFESEAQVASQLNRAVGSVDEFQFTRDVWDRFKKKTAGMSKDIVGEYVEEFAALGNQVLWDHVYKGKTDVGLNDVVSTLIGTPLATAPLSAFSSGNYNKKEFTFSLMFLARNRELFDKIFVDSNIIDENSVDGERKIAALNSTGDLIDLIDKEALENNVDLDAKGFAEGLQQILHDNAISVMNGVDNVDYVERTINYVKNSKKIDLEAKRAEAKEKLDKAREEAAKNKVRTEDLGDLEPMFDKAAEDVVEEEEGQGVSVDDVETNVEESFEGDEDVSDASVDAENDVNKDVDTAPVVLDRAAILEDIEVVRDIREEEGDGFDSIPIESGGKIVRIDRTTDGAYVNRDTGELATDEELSKARSVVLEESPGVESNDLGFGDDEVDLPMDYSLVDDVPTVTIGDDVYTYAEDIDNEDGVSVRLVDKDGNDVLVSGKQGWQLRNLKLVTDNVNEFSELNKNDIDEAIAETGAKPVQESSTRSSERVRKVQSRGSASNTQQDVGVQETIQGESGGSESGNTGSGGKSSVERGSKAGRYKNRRSRRSRSNKKRGGRSARRGVKTSFTRPNGRRVVLDKKTNSWKYEDTGRVIKNQDEVNKEFDDLFVTADNIDSKKSVLTGFVDLSGLAPGESFIITPVVLESIKKNNPELYAIFQPYLDKINNGEIEIVGYSNTLDYQRGVSSSSFSSLTAEEIESRKKVEEAKEDYDKSKREYEDKKLHLSSVFRRVLGDMFKFVGEREQMSDGDSSVSFYDLMVNGSPRLFLRKYRKKYQAAKDKYENALGGKDGSGVFSSKNRYGDLGSYYDSIESKVHIDFSNFNEDALRSEMTNAFVDVTKDDVRADLDKRLREIPEFNGMFEPLAIEESQEQIDGTLVDTENVDTDEMPEEYRKKYEDSKKAYGEETVITIPNGERISGRFVVVDVNSLTPSHDFSNDDFVETEGYPKDNGDTPNDREYNLLQNRRKVLQQTEVDDRAVFNFPIVFKDGGVPSGNERIGILQRAASGKVTRYGYDRVLPMASRGLGVDMDSFSEIENRVLVFEYSGKPVYTKEFFGKFNESDQKSKERAEVVKTISSKVKSNPRVLQMLSNSIEEAGGLEAFFKSSSMVKAFRDYLSSSNFMNDRSEVSKYFRDNGNSVELTPEGRDYVRTIILSSILDNNNISLIDRPGMISYFNRLSSAAQFFAVNQSKDEGYSVASDINEAVRLLNELSKNNLSFADFANQRSLFESTSNKYSGRAFLMAYLLESGVGELKSSIEKINKAADSQGGLFGDADKPRDVVYDDLVSLFVRTKKIGNKILSASDIAVLQRIQDVGFSSFLNSKVDGLSLVFDSVLESNDSDQVKRLEDYVIFSIARSLVGNRVINFDDVAKVRQQILDSGYDIMSYAKSYMKNEPMAFDSQRVLNTLTELDQQQKLSVTPSQIYSANRLEYDKMGIGVRDIENAVGLNAPEDLEINKIGKSMYDVMDSLDFPSEVDDMLDFTERAGYDTSESLVADVAYDVMEGENAVQKSIATAMGLLYPENPTMDIVEMYNFSDDEKKKIKDAYGTDDVVIAYEMHLEEPKVAGLFDGMETWLDYILTNTKGIDLPLQYKQWVNSRSPMELKIVDVDGQKFVVIDSYRDGDVKVQPVEGGVNKKIDPEKMEEGGSPDGTVADDLTESAEKVKKALSKIAPNLEVVMLSDGEFVARFGRGSNGKYDSRSKTIYINKDRADAEVLFHEAAHVVFVDYFRNDPKKLNKFKSILQGVLVNGDISERVLERSIREFANAYNMNDSMKANMPLLNLRSHEYLAQMAALLGRNAHVISLDNKKNIVSKVKKFVDTILGKYSDIDVEIETINDVIGFMNSVANSFRTGEVIDPYKVDGPGVDAGTFSSKSQVFQNGKSYDIYVEDSGRRRLIKGGKVQSIGTKIDPTTGKREKIVTIDNVSYPMAAFTVYPSGRIYLDKNVASRKIGLLSQNGKDLMKAIVDKNFGRDASVVYSEYEPHLKRAKISRSHFISNFEGEVLIRLDNEEAKLINQSIGNFLGDKNINQTVRRILAAADFNTKAAMLKNEDSFKIERQSNDEVLRDVRAILYDVESPEDLWTMFQMITSDNMVIGQDQGNSIISKVIAVSQIMEKYRAFSNYEGGVMTERMLEMQKWVGVASNQASQIFRGVKTNMNPHFATAKNLMAIIERFNYAENDLLNETNVSEDHTVRSASKYLADQMKVTEEEVEQVLGELGILDAIQKVKDSGVNEEMILGIKKIFDDIFEGGEFSSKVYKNVENEKIYKAIDAVFSKFKPALVKNMFGDNISASYSVDVLSKNLDYFLVNVFFGADVDFNLKEFYEENKDVLLYKEKAVLNMKIKAFKEDIKNLNPGNVSDHSLIKHFRRAVNKIEDTLLDDPLVMVETLFNDREEAKKTLSDYVADLEQFKLLATAKETLELQRRIDDTNSTIRALENADKEFINVDESELLKAMTYGLSKISAAELKSYGIEVDLESDPEKNASKVIEYLVKSSAKRGDFTLKTLSEKIAKIMNIRNSNDVDLIANSMKDAFDKHVIEKRKKKLDSLLKVTLKGDYKTFRDRVVEIMEMGDITDTNFKKAFAEKFNMRMFTQEEARDITNLMELQNSLDPKVASLAKRKMNQIIENAQGDKYSKIAKVITSYRYVALLSGYNTVIVSALHSAILVLAENALMSLQIYRRKGLRENINKLKEKGLYERKFGFDAAVVEQFKKSFETGSIITSMEDMPREPYSKLDSYTNYFVDKLFALGRKDGDPKRNVDINLESEPDTTIWRNSPLGVLGVYWLVIPNIITRSLQAVDVLFNMNAIEKAAFIEAHDKTVLESESINNDEAFFRRLSHHLGAGENLEVIKEVEERIEAIDFQNEKLGIRKVTDLERSLMIRNAMLDRRKKVDIVDRESRKKKDVTEDGRVIKEAKIYNELLDKYGRTLTEISRGRIHDASLLNTQVRGGITGMIAAGLTYFDRRTRSGDGGLSVLIADGLLKFFFPIVKVVANGMYNSYNYSLIGALGKLATNKVRGGDIKNDITIRYDVSLGDYLINNIPYKELSKLDANWKSSLRQEGSLVNQLVSGNSDTAALRSAYWSKAIGGTIGQILLSLLFFELGEDEDGESYIKKRDEVWNFIDVTGVGTGNYFENKEKYGDNWKDNTITINGLGGVHFRWTELPAAGMFGGMAMINDLMMTKKDSVSLYDAFKASTLSVGLRILSQGYDIGTNQALTYFDYSKKWLEASGKIGKKGNSEKQDEQFKSQKRKAAIGFAKTLGRNINSQLVMNFWKQTQRTGKEFIGAPKKDYSGDGVFTSFLFNTVKNAPVVDWMMADMVDIYGNKIQEDMDVYFMPELDEFSGNLDKVWDANYSYATPNSDSIKSIVKSNGLITESDLWNIRSSAKNFGKKPFYLTFEDKESLDTLWSSLFREQINKSIDVIADMDEKRAALYIETVAKSIKNMKPYVDLKNDSKKTFKK